MILPYANEPIGWDSDPVTAYYNEKSETNIYNHDKKKVWQAIQDKSKQAVLNAYWKHKAQHERLLNQHLKEEMAQVNRVKSKIKYR